jgi:hypothetical protein
MTSLRELFKFDRFRFYQYTIVAIFPLLWMIALFPNFVTLRWLTGCALGGLSAGLVYAILAFGCRMHQRENTIRSRAVVRGFIYTILGGPLMFVVAVFLDWMLGLWLWLPVVIVVLAGVVLRLLYYIADRTDAADRKKREVELEQVKEKNRINRQEKFTLYLAELRSTFGFFKNQNNYERFRPHIFLRLRVLANAAAVTSQAEEDYKASFKGDGVIDLTTYYDHLDAARIFTNAAEAVRALGFIDCLPYWRDFLIKAYQEDEEALKEAALAKRQEAAGTQAAT